MLKAEIKQEIKDFLKIHGCALGIQIIKNFNIDDARYITNCIEQLILKDEIKKIFYRGFDFYVLRGNELEVKRKIRILKKYIEKVVSKYGPLRAKPLVKKIRDEYDYTVSHLTIYRLVKELIEDGKLGAIKIALSNIYYIKNDQEQALEAKTLIKELESKKKVKKIEILATKFCDRLIIKYNLKTSESQILMEINKKIKPFLNIDCMGRSYNDLLLVLCLILIKREIFYLIRKDSEFIILLPWLSLHEIFLRKKTEVFRGLRNKSFQYFIKQIINKNNFCEDVSRIKIINTPDHFLRMKFLLSYFNLDKEIEVKIMDFIKISIKKGFKISGKDSKGVLGGVIYFITKKLNIRLTQQEIANKLSITEVTLRSRYKEIKVLYEKTPFTIELADNVIDKKQKSVDNNITVDERVIYIENDYESQIQEIEIEDGNDTTDRLFEMLTKEEIEDLSRLSNDFLCFLIDKFHDMKSESFLYNCTSIEYYDKFYLKFNLPFNKKAKRAGRYFNFFKGNYIASDTIYTLRQSRGYGCVKNLEDRIKCQIDSCDQRLKKNFCNLYSNNIWASDYDNMLGTRKGWRFVKEYPERVYKIFLKRIKIPILPFLKILYKDELKSNNFISLIEKFKQDFNFNQEEFNLYFCLSEESSDTEDLNDKKIQNLEKIVNDELLIEMDGNTPNITFEKQIQLIFTANENGIYQTSCGKSYLQKKNLLKHYLGCPECSNQLLKKDNKGFFCCKCGRKYKYSYQFSNHVKHCEDFKDYLDRIIMK